MAVMPSRFLPSPDKNDLLSHNPLSLWLIHSTNFLPRHHWSWTLHIILSETKDGSKEEKARICWRTSPHLSHYSQLRKSCGCPGVSSGGGLFISFQCTMLPLLTRSCLKSNKLRPILNGQFCHEISKNICLNVFRSKQLREILFFVIFKL